VGKLPEQPWPEKIYLRRNSGVRKVTNATELEELLVVKGYVIVEPENLSFLQQAQLFTHAKVIIGSSGAALANIVFAPSNVKVFILIGKYTDTSYWYWQNIACSSGKTVSYVFGEINASDTSEIHADFMIDLDVLMPSIEGAEQ
jgi:capsular polysaccharide biosynthesis protein